MGAEIKKTSKEINMTINFKTPDIRELRPRILVLGVGGAGGNAINAMMINIHPLITAN